MCLITERNSAVNETTVILHTKLSAIIHIQSVAITISKKIATRLSITTKVYSIVTTIPKERN